MPKKKANNRLDKLFDEITKEAQLQAENPATHVKKTSKEVAGKSLDLPHPVDFSGGAKKSPEPSDSSLPISTMLSTAFRTNEMNWATLKIVDESEQRTWGSEEQMLVKQVADQLSLALENARLFQETQLRAEEMVVLNELARALTTQLNVEQVLQETYQGVSRLIETKNFFIGLYNSDRHEIFYPLNVTESIVDKEITSISADQGISGYIFKTREPLLIKSNMREWLEKHNMEAVGDLAASWLGVPLMAGEDFLGVMAMQDYQQPNAYNEHTYDLLTAFASQAAIAIQNARLFEQSQKSAHDLSVLNEFGSELATLERIDQVSECVYKYTSRLFDTSNFYFSLYDLDNEEITPLMVIRENKRLSYSPKNLGNSPTDYILKSKKSLLVNVDFPSQMQSLGIDYIERKQESPPTCFLGVPLLIGQKIFGVLGVQSFDDANIYQEHHQELLTTIANQAAIAIQNVQSFEETQERNKQLASLNEIIVSASQSLDLSKMLSDVLLKYLDAIEFDMGLISIFNSQKDQLELLAGANVPDFILTRYKKDGLAGTLCENVYKIEDIHFIEDLGHANTQDTKYLRSLDANVYLGVPLELRGKTVGTLCAFRRNEGKVSINTINLAISISRQIGFSIENAQLFEDTKANQSKLSEALQVARMGYFEYDLTDGILTITDEMFSLVETSSASEGGNHFPLRNILRRFVVREDRRKFLSAIQEILAKPENQKIKKEIRFKAPAGNIIWVETIFSATKDKDGGVTKIIGSSQDITERKKSEEALRRRNEYLAASSEIGRLVTSTLDLRAIFSRAVNLILERFGFYHASIFIVEETGFNAILQEATGNVGEKLKERKHSLAVGSNSTVGKATGSGEVVVVNNTAFASLHKFNPLLPDTKAEVAIPLRIGNRIIGALDIQSREVDAFSEDDISILQLLSDQIAVGIDNARSYNIAQQAVEEMREVDRLKSQFLANMSHELRTPLNSIIGFARVILKGIDGPITELQQQDLTAIFNSGQHLLGLINDILDLSRIEAGKMELAFDQVNMAELITSVMSTASGLIKDKPIELKREVADDLPLVRADAMRVRQVLINFLSNAAKFTDEGEIIVKAYVEDSTIENPMVMVSVTDTGPGIAQEDQPKLFQPFSQVDASLTRKVGGSGLGLSICQHLIQMHGGKIGVHSSVGKGSTFYFSFPIFQTKPDAEGVGDNKVILAIDDEPQIIKLYERYLQPKGFQVLGLNNPSKAKERVAQLKPFAVILDIMMPGYDGWQVLTELKASSETRDIPVIVCSIVEDEEKGFSLGATDYLLKPVLEDDLLNALDRLNGDGSIRDVLVIDDDVNDLRLLGKMISEQGKYKAILAEGGLAGWRSISSKAPHAVVLDLFMPVMDGFAILEQMRNDKKLRDVPVVVITGADLTGEQQKQLDGLGKRLLQKSSLKETDLIETIENALQKVGTN